MRKEEKQQGRSPSTRVGVSVEIVLGVTGGIEERAQGPPLPNDSLTRKEEGDRRKKKRRFEAMVRTLPRVVRRKPSLQADSFATQ